MWVSAGRCPAMLLVLLLTGTQALASNTVEEEQTETKIENVANVRARRRVDLNIDNDKLFCLLAAEADGRDPSTCDNLDTTCTCVPYWQCRDNELQGGPEANLQPVVNVRVQGILCNVTEHECCDNFDRTAPPPSEKSLNHESKCGQRKPDGFGATFQGFIDRQAQFGEFPWMAAVMTSQKLEGANFYICGASLIHPQVVLTVAHYVNDKTAGELMVRLGEWNFKEQTEPQKHQDFLVRRILIHPQYNPASYQYNVALLFLEGSAVLGPTVDVICLPQPLQDFAGPGCFTSGWGKDVFGQEGSYQQIMKSLELPAVPNPQCERALRTTRLGQFFKLHSSFMCAGGERGNDPCTGDGGSPLVCPDTFDPTRYVQAGIVAWGIGCGQEGIPGVYAAVSHAIDWIHEEMMNNFAFDVRSQV